MIELRDMRLMRELTWTRFCMNIRDGIGCLSAVKRGLAERTFEAAWRDCWDDGELRQDRVNGLLRGFLAAAKMSEQFEERV